MMFKMPPGFFVVTAKSGTAWAAEMMAAFENLIATAEGNHIEEPEVAEQKRSSSKGPHAFFVVTADGRLRE